MLHEAVYLYQMSYNWSIQLSKYILSRNSTYVSKELHVLFLPWAYHATCFGFSKYQIPFKSFYSNCFIVS